MQAVIHGVTMGNERGDTNSTLPASAEAQELSLGIQTARIFEISHGGNASAAVHHLAGAYSFLAGGLASTLPGTPNRNQTTARTWFHCNCLHLPPFGLDQAAPPKPDSEFLFLDQVWPISLLEELHVASSKVSSLSKKGWSSSMRLCKPHPRLIQPLWGWAASMNRPLWGLDCHTFLKKKPTMFQKKHDSNNGKL